MKCFNCDSVMEREDGFDEVNDLGCRPNATYLCEECGFSCIWTLNQPIHILHDPREIYGREESYAA